MRQWNLNLNDPLELTLCSDARLVPTSYTNDQIWQIVCGKGEPPALSVQTTLGLRAKIFRLFPRFLIADRVITNPSTFVKPPVFQKIYPNYLWIAFSPYDTIDVLSEYWIPDCESLACRMQISNTGREKIFLDVEWAALLSPNGGYPMTPLEIEATHILHGKTSELTPVVFATGGPEITMSPYPALISKYSLEPSKSLTLAMSQSSQGNIQDSFKKARSLTARRWEAEIARIGMVNQSSLEIFTGNPDWDAALALSQKTANSLIHSPTSALPGYSCVLTRQPDFGYSFRGDGTDYGFLWNGQTPLDVYYISGFLLPAAHGVMRDLLYNFFHTQSASGFIDLKPGLVGQKSRLLATPLLAEIAWRIYQSSQNDQILRQLYPGLLSFLNVWFSESYDRDADGVPEWDHPLQFGFEEHPLFSYMFNWSKGIDISTIESPALCSFIYNECQRLLQISAQIDKREQAKDLEITLDKLAAKVDSLWSETRQTYLYEDRDTHQTTASEVVAQHIGCGAIEVKKKFPIPCRLSITLHCPAERTVRPKISIYGIGVTGEKLVEQITYDRFRWYMGRGFLTGNLLYRQIKRIDIQDINAEDQVTFKTIDYDFLDHSSLLPLWAGIPDRSRAEKLIKSTLTNPDCYWSPFGIPACPQTSTMDAESGYQAIYMQFNSLIGEGLIRYGHHEEAAELVSRLMSSVILNLKNEKAFFQYYHPYTGKGFGERNVLSGLPPLGLFLRTLGIYIINPRRVKLEGINPYSWPITVKYRGLSILKGKDKTIVTFPNGQSTTIEEPSPCTISLE